MQEPLEPQCPLSKYQWKRTEKEPKACPRIVDKHLLQILTRKAGDARILLTVHQMKTLGLGHMCWDGYVEVGNQFYRPLLPPIIKEGMIHEIRNIGIDPCVARMTLRRVSANTAININMAWRGADQDLAKAVFTWAAPIDGDSNVWPRLTKNCTITILPTIPDTYLVPFHNQTGTVMTRDVDGSLQLRFAGHHKRVELCEQQAPYIQANEPSCTWKIIALTTPTMAVTAPCRQRTTVDSRQRKIPLSTVRWILAQQAQGCQNGVVCDFREDLTTTQKERCLQRLGMTFDLQRPEMLHTTTDSEVVRQTKSNSNIGPAPANRDSLHVTDAHMQGSIPAMPESLHHSTHVLDVFFERVTTTLGAGPQRGRVPTEHLPCYGKEQTTVSEITRISRPAWNMYSRKNWPITLKTQGYRS